MNSRRRLAAAPTICQLLHSLVVGGGEVLAAHIARRLGARYRFVFVCLDQLGTLGEALQAEGMPVHVVGRRPGVDWGCAVQLARVLRRERVDLLHAHQYAPFFYGATARWFSRRVPLVFTEHGRLFPDYRRPKRVWANRFLLGRHDRVIGVGKAVRQALVANEGLAERRVDVIYNGIDLLAYRNGAAAHREALRREWGCQPDSLVITQVARLDPLKDHATAIRAFERVHAVLPNSFLVLVGEGPDRARIESEIAAKRCRANIRLLGLRNDVPTILAAADLFWLTSVSEGIPLTLIEAMAAGLPVVSTNVGGVAEVVQADETGILVPAGDDAGLAAAVLHITRDSKARARMAEAGCRRANEKFSDEHMLCAYDRLYQELLGD